MGEFASAKPVLPPREALNDKHLLDLPDRLLDFIPAGIYICDHQGLIVRYNRCAAELWGYAPKLSDAAYRFYGSYRLHDGSPVERSQNPMAVVLATGASIRNEEIVIDRPDGSQIVALLHIDALKDEHGAITGAIACLRDITERQRLQDEAREAAKRAHEQLSQHSYRLEMLNRITKAISSNLNLEDIVQTVTDAATELSGAKFGAFFHNIVDAQGERYLLYTLSGAPRAAFEKLGLPRNTALFEPTFRGTGIIRSDDIRADPRYGKSGPHHGMPKGHLPVVSYLAVPVISKTGEVHGGLLLGHDKPGMFTAEAEDVVAAIAAHAAIAIDNARLFQTAQMEIEQRRRAELGAQRLAAIVESSADAIVSKNLDGIIMSWNDGAERLFGYSEQEVIGKPITIIMPAERHDEEPAILSRIRCGERIQHYETVRRRKDGSLVEISLTVSPIKDASGQVIGASKIARDITERRRAEEQQRLLMSEMNHRIKNLFTVAGSIVALSARHAATPESLAESVKERLAALARAHDLTLTKTSYNKPQHMQATTLHALIGTILSPFKNHEMQHEQLITVRGPDVPIAGASVTAFALLLHELATNAAKYGALSSPTGRIDIECAEDSDRFILSWTEYGGPSIEVTQEEEEGGFGGLLVRATLQRIGGKIVREWRPEGLAIRLTIARARLG
jgi:PAS domain S-box-containing protein